MTHMPAQKTTISADVDLTDAMLAERRKGGEK